MLRCFATDRATRHLVPVVMTAVGVEMGLRTIDLRRLAGLAGVVFDLGGRPQADGAVRLDPAERARVRAVQLVMRRWPWGANGPCLRQALVAGRMLRHRRPCLALGASRHVGGALAHAWLVVDGVALDSDPDRWTPLLRPGAG